MDPDPQLTDVIRSKLGWDNADAGDYTLKNARADTITQDEVRLKSRF